MKAVPGSRCQHAGCGKPIPPDRGNEKNNIVPLYCGDKCAAAERKARQRHNRRSKLP